MTDTMTGLKRTHYCGQPRMSDVGSEITLFGWVQRQRDLGQLIFIDLRDRTGVTQLAFDDGTDRDIFDKAFAIRSEFVLAVKGTLRERSAKNPDLPTGDVELFVTDLRILSKSETPPFEIVENSKVGVLFAAMRFFAVLCSRWPYPVSSRARRPDRKSVV